MFGISEETITLILYFFSITTFHGFYISIIGIIRNRKNKSKISFSIVTILISGLMLAYILFLNKTVLLYPFLFRFMSPFLFLLGLFYFTYVYFNIFPDKKIKPIFVLHLLPFLYYLMDWIIYLNLDAPNKLLIIQSIMDQNNIPTFVTIIQSSFPFIHFLIYSFISFKLIQKHQSSGSNIKKVTLVLIYLIILFIFLPYIMVSLGQNFALYELLMLTLLAIFIHYISYKILFDKELLLKRNKYKTSPLSENEMDLIMTKIKNFFEFNNAFLNQNFKISNLSSLINIPTHHISQVLNVKMRTNFSSLINIHRIKEVNKRLLSEKYTHYSFLAIAKDCGFKNKSNFNRIFRQVNNMTPTQYIAGNKG